MSLATDPIDNVIDFLVRYRVGTAELCMEIGCIIRHISQGIIYLVIEGHPFIVQVFHGDPAFLPERHVPVTVEGRSGIHADGQRRNLVINFCGCKEVSYGDFHGRFFFIIPIETEYGISPFSCRRHPDLLNGSRPFDFCHCKCFSCRYSHIRIHLPSLSQVPRSISSTAFLQGGHTTFPFFPGKILGTDGTGFRIRKTIQIIEVNIQTVKCIPLCGQW